MYAKIFIHYYVVMVLWMCMHHPCILRTLVFLFQKKILIIKRIAIESQTIQYIKQKIRGLCFFVVAAY